jgi:hypothetical protein
MPVANAHVLSSAHASTLIPSSLNFMPPKLLQRVKPDCVKLK